MQIDRRDNVYPSGAICPFADTPHPMGGTHTGGPSAQGWQQITAGETRHSHSTTPNLTLCFEADCVELQQIYHFLELDFIYVTLSNIRILLLQPRAWTALKASSKPVLIANLLAAFGSFRGASAGKFMCQSCSVQGRDAGQLRILKSLLHSHWE